MKVLVADDDPVVRCRVEGALHSWGYPVVTVGDGASAAVQLLAPDGPSLAIIDWGMPGANGLEVCRQVRAAALDAPPYLIVLTARAEKGDLITGLSSGADDFMVKPFEEDELQARVRVGERIVNLQTRLNDQVAQLKNSLAQVKLLHGLLPICCYCKRIRDGHDYWQQVEAYISSHSEAHFSHTFCPECYERHVRPELEKALGRSAPPAPEVRKDTVSKSEPEA